MRVSGHRHFSMNTAGPNVSNQRFWPIAILTAAGAFAAITPADAALFYWQDSDPSYYRPSPTPQSRRQRTTRRPAAKAQAAHKETGAKPQGPLIIAVSIEQQKVRVYDANGLFAESPVSTGMKGHSTPMGVFSVIQKHRLHHSNIYSNAPMPYMQRITWSGVALHAGVLPGYPASHGCIRMPAAFAIKMWNWTKMGARVIVTPGAITPASFSHPFLVAQKVVPQPPLIADDPKLDAPAVKSDKGADAGAAPKPANSSLANSEGGLDLRSTVGHAQTHTADASSAMPANNAAATMSDAGPSNGMPPAAAATEAPKAAEADVAVEKDEKKADEAQAGAPSTGEPAKADSAASESVKAEDKPANAEATAAIAKAQPEAAKAEQTKDAEAKAAETKAAETKAVEKPAEPVNAVGNAPAVAPDAKKDTARVPGGEKTAKPEPPRRPGQIAVFVSRKDSKLYVRESFKPLFDVPVTIAPSDRPLGTHVFTAEADKKDPNLLRWSVVSLPVTVRGAAPADDDERPSRRRKAAAEAKPLPMPNNPAEALDRITVPENAMTRIAEALTTGGSVIVSDQGVSQGGETGEGTDFIVPLRMVQP